MMNATCRVTSRMSLWAAVFSIALCASAAAQTATTPFGRAMEKLDLGVSGIGEFTPSNSGTNLFNQSVAAVPSNTLGALVQLRYTKSPLIGVELELTATPVITTPYNVGSGTLPAHGLTVSARRSGQSKRIQPRLRRTRPCPGRLQDLSFRSMTSAPLNLGRPLAARPGPPAPEVRVTWLLLHRRRR